MTLFNNATWLTVLLAMAAGGCSAKSEFEMAQARGIVLVKGQPVAEIAVVLHPEKGPQSFGVTDAHGQFEMTTLTPGDGALVGEHKVTLVWTDPKATYKGPSGPSPIPERYSLPATSQLTTVIIAGQKNELTFRVND